MEAAAGRAGNAGDCSLQPLCVIDLGGKRQHQAGEQVALQGGVGGVGERDE